MVQSSGSVVFGKVFGFLIKMGVVCGVYYPFGEIHDKLLFMTFY